MPKTKTVPTFSLSVLEYRFQFASYWFFGQWCPAVYKLDDGRYHIRTLRSETPYRNGHAVTYDYFELDADGTVTAAPRGYARDYKPGRFDPAALDEAVAKYASPEPEVETR